MTGACKDTRLLYPLPCGSYAKEESQSRLFSSRLHSYFWWRNYPSNDLDVEKAVLDRGKQLPP